MCFHGVGQTVTHTCITSSTGTYTFTPLHEKVCLPYRWWKEAQDSAPSDGKSAILYAVAPAPSYGGPMKLIGNIFSPDVAFNLRREDESLSQNQENGEVGVSGRDYALVPGDIWLQALKWLVVITLFSLYSLKCI